MKKNIEKLPLAYKRATKRVDQINVDDVCPESSVPDSVASIEWYKYAVIFTDCCSGYQWRYILNSREKILNAVQKRYCAIAELWEKYPIFGLIL